MNSVQAAGRPQVADAFFGNQLLSTLDPETRDLLAAGASLVWLEVGESVLAPGENVVRSLFPFGRTMISMVVEVGERRTVEVASIGREGAVGGIVSCGDIPAFSRADVIVEGYALSLPMALLEELKSRSAHLKNLFCRYADFLLAQIMQGAACNSFHPIEARTARWLLTADDRAGPQLDLTQEALARLLGAQRTTINAVIGQFERDRLVELRRGSITIRDRAAVEGRACNCYRAVDRFFDAAIGKSGTGEAG